MIGVFDSGVGGFNAFTHLRRRFPLADIAYLADRKNAPYGTKSEVELVSLVGRCIDRLRSCGAEKVLIACCTASTVWDRLSEGQREASVPIISCVESLFLGKEKNVLVIATERTVASGEFGRIIKKKCPLAHVVEVPMQNLVRVVEDGVRLGEMALVTRFEIDKIRALADLYCPDTLVLGCTHFSSVRDLIADAAPMARIVNPAFIGAEAMAEEIELLGINTKEQGRIIYM